MQVRGVNNLEENRIKNQYENGEFITIIIDKEFILENALNLIQQSIRLTPLYGGHLNVDAKYEIILTFDSNNIKINKKTIKVEVKKE